MSVERLGLVAARRFWDPVPRNDTQVWLGMMAADIVIDDPIGVSPLEAGRLSNLRGDPQLADVRLERAS